MVAGGGDGTGTMNAEERRLMLKQSIESRYTRVNKLKVRPPVAARVGPRPLAHAFSAAAASAAGQSNMLSWHARTRAARR